MIVRFTPRAEADLVGILDYLERRSPNGARRVAASLLQTIEVVASHPQSGASTRRPDIFVKVAARHPYKILGVIYLAPSSRFGTEADDRPA